MPMYFVESGGVLMVYKMGPKKQLYMGVGNPYKWPYTWVYNWGYTTTYKGYNTIYIIYIW